MKNHIFFVILLFLSSCVQKEELPPTAENTIVNKYLSEVNLIRKTGVKCGSKYFGPVNAVIWNDVLEKTSIAHSKDMFNKKILSHTGSDGSTPAQRITKNGYKYTFFGENIQTISGFEPDETLIINNWKMSPSHCENLMNPNFKEMAVGRYQNYWTQILASK